MPVWPSGFSIWAFAAAWTIEFEDLIYFLRGSSAKKDRKGRLSGVRYLLLVGAENPNLRMFAGFAAVDATISRSVPFQFTKSNHEPIRQAKE